ncbi:L-fucose:H+ symporter permease [Pedobacter puniceum]|jgi:FHS family L-fucose permease-like MFS transporter|uniref:L-fucose:H+ symporter permease n=1 Tax=Pedobacter puniceum TaxID=2666136 RepID=A0A7K0FQ73_9SPHI|nr:L-fucose:H+ symporter permease [Pedobacter puniceum]MRX48119.1 L-fucose:H+ symporter permease [Pedobacter puniceum]
MTTSKKGSTNFAFIMITILFFMWGFVHNLDPILIPHLKRAFSLTTLQASLVDSAVFIAYFVVALPAGFLLKKKGYKAGIILGLMLFALGSYLFIPSANLQSYTFFLVALFIIACGLTILETAANPYASLLGPPEKATQRLNLAQSFNGLAATLAPIVGARIILTEGLPEEKLALMTPDARQLALAAEAATVKMPYFILGSVILILAVIFFFMKLPEIKEEDKATQGSSLAVFRHKHLNWAIAAQFFYVGAQVCIFSFFILYATHATGISEIKAAEYAGFGVGMAFMVGRFVGTFFMKFVKPPVLLAIYAVLCMTLSISAMYITGLASIYIVIGIAFFMSIMFPTIFSLGIKELGEDTKLGSSFIIMSIVGGAILPLIFGHVSDLYGNIQLGYIVPAFCFFVILIFAVHGHKVSTVKK